MAIETVNLRSMMSSDYGTIELYSEFDKGRISNTQAKKAKDQANDIENRKDAIRDLDTLNHDTKLPEMQYKESRGTQWLELGKTKIRVRFFSPVSLLESHREGIQEPLYRYSKRQRSRACLATFDVSDMPENQFYVFYAFFKRLLESVDSTKHGCCIVAALLKGNEDPERNRLITAPFFDGVSAQPSLASARNTLGSRHSVDNDNTEGPSEDKVARDWGHNYSQITVTGGTVMMGDTHFGPYNKGFQAAHIGGDVSGTNFYGEEANTPRAATQTATNVHDAYAEVKRTLKELNEATVEHINLQKERGDEFRRTQRALERLQRKDKDYEDAKIIYEPLRKEAERVSREAITYPSTTPYTSEPANQSSDYTQPALPATYDQPVASTSTSNYVDESGTADPAYGYSSATPGAFNMGALEIDLPSAEETNTPRVATQTEADVNLQEAYAYCTKKRAEYKYLLKHHGATANRTKKALKELNRADDEYNHLRASREATLSYTTIAIEDGLFDVSDREDEGKKPQRHAAPSASSTSYGATPTFSTASSGRRRRRLQNRPPSTEDFEQSMLIRLTPPSRTEAAEINAIRLKNRYQGNSAPVSGYTNIYFANGLPCVRVGWNSKYLDELTPEELRSLGRLYLKFDGYLTPLDDLTAEQRTSIGINQVGSMEQSSQRTATTYAPSTPLSGYPSTHAEAYDAPPAQSTSEADSSGRTWQDYFPASNTNPNQAPEPQPDYGDGYAAD